MTSTLLAASGPLFESVTVNVIVSPTFGVALSTVFTTARSASRVVTVASSRLLPVFGSNWSAFVTAATLVNEPGPATAAAIVRISTPPTGSVLTVQTPLAGL